MTLFQALVLGVVQGLTEYIPVSSSAHLVMVPRILGWTELQHDGFVFDVLIQLGTLLGVAVYFFREIRGISQDFFSDLRQFSFKSSGSIFVFHMLVATIPACFFGLLFKKQIAELFDSPKHSAWALIVTALMLASVERFSRRLRNTIHVKDALIMGLAQAFAIIPGISRSGATISAGMMNGLDRHSSARFSFLMSFPVMIGASLVAALDFKSGDPSLHHFAPLLVGFIASAVTGYFVVRWFMNFLRHRSLYWFAAYCFVVGTLGALYF